MAKNKLMLILAIALTLIIIGVIVYAIIRSGKVKKKAAIIARAIDSGTGAMGTDIDSVLANTNPDPNYSVKDSDLVKLKDARGWVSDSPEYITQVLSGKTKAQIKSIIIAFNSKYGIKFNDHLNDLFGNILHIASAYDSAGYNAVLNLVRNAK